MLGIEIGYTSFVEKLKSTKFLCSTLSLVLFIDLCLVLSVHESVISVKADTLKAISIKDIALFATAYIFIEGYVIPALYGFYAVITLLIKGRGFSLIAKFTEQSVAAIRYALVTDNSVAYALVQRVQKRVEDVYDLGSAALGLIILSFAELLAASEVHASSLIEEVAHRAFGVDPTVGYLTIVAEGFFFMRILSWLLRSTRFVERGFPFREIFQSPPITGAPGIQAEWQYSGTVAQHWPAADG